MSEPRPYPATRTIVVVLQVIGAIVAVLSGIVAGFMVQPLIAPNCSPGQATGLSFGVGAIVAALILLPFQFFAEALAIGRDIAVNVAKLAERKEPPARPPAPHDPETEAALHRLTQSAKVD
ncbi:MAG: hypothetical protein HZA51_15635 [Planctomycetes bacterium]|nr:hypothetical protein [Planctomycetota bacterium]